MSDTLEIIENLIETCRNGQACYLEARECTNDSELKDFFGVQVLERATFARELENVAQGLGKASRSVANQAHCTWFDEKQKTGSNDQSLLECVEAGETNAEKQYQQALKSNLPPDVHKIVEKEAIRVFGAHKEICNLRDQSRGQYQRVA